jgi:cytochrome c oxidase assembly protein subunit 15
MWYRLRVTSGSLSIGLSDTPRAGAGQRRFVQFAALLLAYLLFVILFGAWVRITGSGAGCGDFWPTCHGQLLPRTPTEQTIIEFTHRSTSGLLGLMALALPVWAWRSFPAPHPVRWLSLATLLLVMLEAAIGAGIVLRQLVASDASRARAVAVALHLGNTLLLTACAALTLAVAHAPRAARSTRSTTARSGAAWLLGVLLLSLGLVASSGAVTALGDTLFPVHPGALGAALPPADHFLVQLRVVHPVLACLAVCLALGVARHFAAAEATRPWARALGILASAQLGLGGLNISLNAPGWLQLAHLLLAQLLWISAVLLTWRWARARDASGVSS